MVLNLPKILVVGGGSIGERHARCFQSTDRAQVWLCEVDDSRRTAVIQRNHLAGGYATLDQGLAESPTAVVIATPAPLHIPMARQAVTTGCHVLIEKPLSTHFDGIQELLTEAAAQQRRVDVAYVTRAHPVFAQFRDAVLSGRFGAILQFVSVSGQNFPFYRPAYRETYYTRHETGGGAVQDALTHGLNAAEWIVGPVDRLVADADHLALPGVSVEDSVTVMTRHQRVMGVFSLNQHQAPNESSLTILCERGAVRYEAHHQRWQYATEPGQDWCLGGQQILERDELFQRQAERFLDLIAGRESQPLCSLEAATQTLKVNLAILRSVQNQTWEEISR